MWRKNQLSQPAALGPCRCCSWLFLGGCAARGFAEPSAEPAARERLAKLPPGGREGCACSLREWRCRRRAGRRSRAALRNAACCPPPHRRPRCRDRQQRTKPADRQQQPRARRSREQLRQSERGRADRHECRDTAPKRRSAPRTLPKGRRCPCESPTARRGSPPLQSSADGSCHPPKKPFFRFCSPARAES